jgi:dCTP diphosphatase
MLPYLPTGRLWYSGEVILNDLQRELRDFAAQRDWQRFHAPKNLVMALSGEVGELTELFQWLTPAESATVMERAGQAERVRQEVADVFAYLLQIADALDIDLVAALRAKMTINDQKYPVSLATGRAEKYDQLRAEGPEA